MKSHHRRWPWMTRYGVHFLHSPIDYREYRIDPHGEEKAAERQAASESLSPRLHFGGVAFDPPRYIHLYLQVLDPSAGWADRPLCIDTEKLRFIEYGEGKSPYAGDPHRQAKATHVSHLLFPVVAAMAPFMAYSTWRNEREEAAYGMSRYGIALLRKLAGQLDPRTEVLLEQVLRKEWRLKMKLERPVDVAQACEALSACALTVTRSPAQPDNPYHAVEFASYRWVDDEDDLIGCVSFAGTEPFCARVLGSTFVSEDAAERAKDGPTRVPQVLTTHFKEKREIVESPHVASRSS